MDSSARGHGCPARGPGIVLRRARGPAESLAAWTPILSTWWRPSSSRISAIHRHPTALYLAPTKALAADQLAFLARLLGQNDAPTDALGERTRRRHRLVDESAACAHDGRGWGHAARGEGVGACGGGPDPVRPGFPALRDAAVAPALVRFLASLRAIVIDRGAPLTRDRLAYRALVVRRLLRVAHRGRGSARGRTPARRCATRRR